MAGSWLEADQHAAVPGLGELVASVRDIRFVPGTVGPELLALAERLRTLLVDGGVVVTTVQVEADDVAAWFIARNHVSTYGLIEHLLGSDAVADARTPLGVYDERAASRTFTESAALHLDGDLALALVQGGAYARFEGPWAGAKRIAHTVCQELFGDRFEDVRVDRSDAAWSQWFHEVAWDHSWVVTDRRRQRMTLICLTDTD